MDNDEHLVQTFYISKPQTQPIAIFDDPETASSQDLKQSIIRIDRAPKNTAKLEKQKSHQKHERIYKMIKKQINPTAQVRPKLISHQLHKNKSASGIQFLNQFNNFFQGFIEKNQLTEQLLKIRRTQKKKTTKKVNYRTQQDISNEFSKDEPDVEEQQEDQELFIKKKVQKMSYHERMRQQIESKMDGLISHGEETKLHRVEMSNQKKYLQLNKMLKVKEKCKKAPPKLRLIRSGLPIRISELQPKAKTMHKGAAEDQKAKKDHIFFKSLQKNCEVVRSQLDNYQHGKTTKKLSKYGPKKHKKGNGSYMRQTCSNSLKKSSINIRRSLDDGDGQRWQAMCASIEGKYTNNLKKSRQLSGGLKVFAGYCKYMDGKWKDDKERIQQALHIEPTFSYHQHVYTACEPQLLSP